MHELLLRLGLSDKEAAVYLAVLELGEDTALRIAEKSKVNRATTYVALDRLMELGVVSTITRGKKAFFVAEDPSELQSLLSRQMQELQDRQRLLDGELNQFKAIYNREKKNPIVRFYEGPEGLESLDRAGKDLVRPNAEVYSIGPVGLIEKYFPQRRASALKERVRVKMHSRMVYTRPIAFTDDENRSADRESVHLSEEQLPITGTVQIYPDWGVKYFNFEEGNFFGVLIQNRSVAKNLLEIYKLAERGAKLVAEDGK